MPGWRNYPAWEEGKPGWGRKSLPGDDVWHEPKHCCAQVSQWELGHVGEPLPSPYTALRCLQGALSPCPSMSQHVPACPSTGQGSSSPVLPRLLAGTGHKHLKAQTRSNFSNKSAKLQEKREQRAECSCQAPQCHAERGSFFLFQSPKPRRFLGGEFPPVTHPQAAQVK